MKRLHILLIVTACCGVMTSCFKDEPLNAECDIEEAYLHSDTPEAMFFNLSDSLVKVLYNESSIDFKVRKEVDRTALAPRFRITEGATIVPANGSTHDFTAGPVTYTVTSEDGQWKKEYQVSVSVQTRTVSDTICYDFENYWLETKNQKYYIWSDVNEDGSYANNWATGNSGFAISRSSATVDQYPTIPVVDGYDGSAVKLETCDTGAFGLMKNMRLAAGNLFIGRFDATQAILEDGAMKATMFGLTYTAGRRPVSLSGYYKYSPGAKFQDRNGNTVSGRTDAGSIYAVLYRNTDANGNAVVLYGDDVLTSSQIVGLADMGEVPAAEGWTYFEVPFEYYEEVSQDLLDNYGYNLTVVFSSSIDGATFEGAIGSILYIDKVRLVCESTE